jgi:hypothetical protein
MYANICPTMNRFAKRHFAILRSRCLGKPYDVGGISQTPVFEVPVRLHTYTDQTPDCPSWAASGPPHLLWKQPGTLKHQQQPPGGKCSPPQAFVDPRNPSSFQPYLPSSVNSSPRPFFFHCTGRGHILSCAREGSSYRLQYIGLQLINSDSLPCSLHSIFLASYRPARSLVPPLY